MGGRHKYYMHEDGIGMNSLKNPGKSVAGGKNPYDVTVTTAMGNKSDEDMVKPDNESEDVWPLQGIKKTVDITVS
jgi:hypothetical protein